MYPQTLRALAADVIFDNITDHYDYLMTLDHAIGYTHDVGSRLLEVEEMNMEKEKEKEKENEKYKKLMNVFINKIRHKEKV